MTMKIFGLALLVMVSLAAGAQPSAGQQQQPAKGSLKVGHGPPQFPADPRMFISAKEIQERIAQADADVKAGRMYGGEPLVMQGPFRATMEWRNVAQANVNVHETDAEMFVVIEGSGTMTLGGNLVDPHRAHSFAWEGPTLTAKSVEGGKDYKIGKGDMIMIPPNTAHYVSQVHGKLVLWSMHLPMLPVPAAGTAAPGVAAPAATPGSPPTH
jgi:mannose-6-phosphate isomerase-like protein (cupin superfamily)